MRWKKLGAIIALSLSAGYMLSLKPGSTSGRIEVRVPREILFWLDNVIENAFFITEKMKLLYPWTQKLA